MLPSTRRDMSMEEVYGGEDEARRHERRKKKEDTISIYTERKYNDKRPKQTILKFKH
jgi:hypothetical protein